MKKAKEVRYDVRLLRCACAVFAAVALSLMLVPEAVPASATGSPTYYLSLGDSLAEGYQPGFTGGVETLEGYSDRVVTDLQPKAKLVLENFGCGGATTGSLINSDGCPPGDLANDGVTYPDTSQLAAAVSFINSHPNQIALVTIDIGGNDLLENVPNATIVSNIQSIAEQLRAAVGPSVPIFGVGYPDQTLANWLQGSRGKIQAKESISQVRQSINPLFERAYKPSSVTFLDVAGEFGAFVPFTKFVKTSHYGVVPLAVARICELTWGCVEGNQHPTTAGYALMAREIAQAYTHVESGRS